MLAVFFMEIDVKRKKVLIDMDGVLTQFTPAAMRLFGVEFSPCSWPAGEYDISKVLGVSPREMWAAIDKAGYEFWEGLDRHSWIDDLIGVIENAGYDWWIATSPSSDAMSLAGKLAWLHRNFGKRFRRYQMGPDKWLMADQETTLIDDGEHNIKRFVDAGGHAILFPQHWNSSHLLATDPVSVVLVKL